MSSPVFTTAVIASASRPSGEPGPVGSHPRKALTPNRNFAPPTPPVSTVIFTSAILPRRAPGSLPELERARAGTGRVRGEAVAEHIHQPVGRIEQVGVDLRETDDDDEE